MDFSGQTEPYIQMYFGQTRDKTTDKGETLGSCEDVSCEPETGSWHPVELPGGEGQNNPRMGFGFGQNNGWTTSDAFQTNTWL